MVNSRKLMNAKYYYTQRLMLRLIIFPDKKIKKMDYKALCINSKVFIDKECSDIFYEIVLFLSKKKILCILLLFNLNI